MGEAVKEKVDVVPPQPVSAVAPVDMEQVRVQAGVQEMNSLIQAQLQRSVDLSGQLAVTSHMLRAAEAKVAALEEELKTLRGAVGPDDAGPGPASP